MLWETWTFWGARFFNCYNQHAPIFLSFTRSVREFKFTPETFFWQCDVRIHQCTTLKWCYRAICRTALCSWHVALRFPFSSFRYVRPLKHRITAFLQHKYQYPGNARSSDHCQSASSYRLSRRKTNEWLRMEGLRSTWIFPFNGKGQV